MTTNTGKYKEEIWLKIKKREFSPSSLKTRDVHVLNFFQFSLPPPLSQRQKLLSANSQMLKVFKTFVATASLESPLLHFFFSDFSLVGEVRPPTCELSLEYRKVGGGGRLLWLESGIQPISFLFSSFSRWNSFVYLLSPYFDFWGDEIECCMKNKLLQNTRWSDYRGPFSKNNKLCEVSLSLWSPWLSWSCLIAVVNVFKVMFPNHLGQMSQRVSKVGRTNRHCCGELKWQKK